MLFSPRRILALSIVVAVAIGLFTSFTRVDSTEIAVFQAPFTGALSVETKPGTYMRVGASVSTYHLQDSYSFEWVQPNKDGTKASGDNSISVQYADGGKGSIGGNVQWEMPLAEDTVLAMHRLYRSQNGVDKAIIANAINRAMTLTSTLMTATDSYAARRAEFIQLFADQLINGPYQTRSIEVRQPDPITGEQKIVRVVDIQKDSSGTPLRAEESALRKYGITIQPPTLTHFQYEEKVEAQIQQARDNILAIQTAQAEAKKAEQAAITAVKNGEAQAAKARADQEVIRATVVTKAEQERQVAEIDALKQANVAKIDADRNANVAKVNAERDLQVRQLDAQQALQEKLANIARGEGEAARRAAVLAADGALDAKINAYLEAQRVWAAAFKDYRGNITPQIVTGGSGAGGGNAAMDFMSLMSMQAAKSLALDPAVTTPRPAVGGAVR